MEAFITVYLAIGFLIAVGLAGWAAVSSIRRQGFDAAVRNGARSYIEELPLNWRVPVAGWMFAIALPLITGWEIVKGDFDLVGAAFVFVLWLLYLGLLRWHYRARARARTSEGAARLRAAAPPFSTTRRRRSRR